MENHSDTLSYRVFGAIADSVIKRPWAWVVLWLVLLGLALPGGMKVQSVMIGANSGMANAEFQKAQDLIEQKFDFAFAVNYQVVVESQIHTVKDAPMRQAIDTLSAVLAKRPDTRAIQTVYDSPEPALLQSKDGHKTFLMVGQQAISFEEQQAFAGPLREQLKPTIAGLQKQDPSLKVLVTGMNTVLYDVDKATSSSTSEAEKNVILLTMLLLLLAFGSLTGALLPGLIAMFSTGIGMGIIYQIALRTPVSIFAQSISTMIGLAVGIDYALLMVWRLREEIGNGHPLPEALRRTVIQAGKSVFFAGLTFIVGLSGLFFARITALSSIGLGGVTVVLLSMLLSLTLLPALLLLAGRWLEFPRFLSQRLSRLKPGRIWEPLALKIMQKPVLIGGLALAAVLLLSAPALQLKVGEFDLWHLPPEMESRQGLDRLSQMSVSGIMVPIFMVVASNDGSEILTSERLTALRKIENRLQAEPIIARVYGVAGTGDEAGGQALFNQLPLLRLSYPQLFDQFVSRDQSMTMIQVIPRHLQENDAQVRLVDHLRKTLPAELAPLGLKLYIGGPAAISLEFNQASFRHMPMIVTGIIFATLLFLFWALRSYLISLKAVLLNLCSVGMSYGAITLIFQGGLLPGVLKSSIVAYVPLLLFCIIFGMSIDYEVFLMARIREEHQLGHSNEQATARGIRATGDVITYAALIMCIVFGAFTLVPITIIKQLGFGLATAIFVDATLIRMVLVPAFMKIAGDWNWYPGSRQSRSGRSGSSQGPASQSKP